MTDNELSNDKEKHEEVIFLRNYSKAIFLFPLLFTSFILWLIEASFGQPRNPIMGLGFIWTLVFFINIIAVTFDISSAKFFIVLLIIIILILVLIFFLIPATLSMIYIEFQDFEFNIGMTFQFYMVMTIIFALALMFSLIGPRFDYWRLERNEIYHKKGIFTQAERYPTQGLRIKKSIPDILEFIFLRAGSITLILGKDDIAHLSTITNINKKSKKIDYLLSEMDVEVEKPSSK
jgi:hypothetical protein